MRQHSGRGECMSKSTIIQARAVGLRRNQTEAERIIWNFVRNNRLGYKFKRQQPIDHYIVDFICFEKRMVVEIDGGQHTQENDAIRTAYLQNNGFTLTRFWNNDVMENPDGVYQALCSALEIPSPYPSPARGEGL